MPKSVPENNRFVLPIWDEPVIHTRGQAFELDAIAKETVMDK